MFSQRQAAVLYTAKNNKPRHGLKWSICSTNKHLANYQCACVMLIGENDVYFCCIYITSDVVLVEWRITYGYKLVVLSR